jgi:hypothetical protein
MTLAVPGGLAGQIFAVGYASWLALHRRARVHVRFHDMGTGISKLGVAGLFDTPTAKSLGITFSTATGGWADAENLSVSLRLQRRILALASHSRHLRSAAKAYRVVVRELRGLPDADSAIGTGESYRISLRDLESARPGSTISGYPTDYQVIENAWPVLSRILAEFGFCLPQQGKLHDTVAIHWRLGDYQNNDYHGAVSWDEIENCLRYANPDGFPIRIFTDSPEAARELMKSSFLNNDVEIISNDIWSDLESMMQSKVFIGSHSGVSFLAALAQQHDDIGAKTWLPNRWFKNQRAQESFVPTKLAFGKSALYPVDL